MTPCDVFLRAAEHCTGEAEVLCDTSDGHLPPEQFCQTCARAYAEWLRNYDGPDA